MTQSWVTKMVELHQVLHLRTFLRIGFAPFVVQRRATSLLTTNKTNPLVG